ncbi:MAG: PAS domain S-box protein [Salinivirgaceae bacterium]|nr:PAS domain S-box protein [Salinivirgaceae bacterium]
MKLFRKQESIIHKINYPILIVKINEVEVYTIEEANQSACDFLGLESMDQPLLNSLISDRNKQDFIQSLSETTNIVQRKIEFINSKTHITSEAIVDVEPLNNQGEFVITLKTMDSNHVRAEKMTFLPEIIETFPVGITVYENKELKYINKALQNITGYDLEELYKNQTPLFYTSLENKNRVTQIYNNLFQQKEIVEFWIKTKNGDRKYIQNYFYQLSSLQDIFFIITIDITIRKITINDLEKKTTEFKTLADHSPDIIVRFNREFSCTYANPSLEPITGYNRNDSIGKNINDLGFNEDTLTILKKSFVECFAERKKKTLNYTYTIRGAERNFETIMVPEVSEESNTIQSILTISRDITSQQRMIDQIAQSEKYYKLMANNSTDIIWTMDQHREITYVSPAVKNVLGYSPSEFTTAVFEASFTEDTFVNFQIKINEIFKLIKLEEYEKIRKDYQLQVQQYDNKHVLKHIDITINVNLDKAGKIDGIIGVSQDVSARRKAELELITTREKALEADQLKTAFLANMSHEIRTPMNGIIGFTDLLAEEDIEPEQRSEYLELINANTNQLLQLIDDIIDISRIESGQLEIRNRKIDIIQILDNIVKTHVEKLRHSLKSNLEIIFESKHDELIVDIDPIRLTQILSNLIGNSVKFTEKGSITISYTNKNNTEIQFSVADTGIGLTQEKIDYIFDRFRQADEQDSRKYGGAGLGLSIAKNLVDLMGGLIWAESNEQNGASFFFTIPHEWEQIIETKEEILTNLFDENTEISNILIVEDEEVNFILIRETLKDHPYRLFWAHDGLEALDIVKEETIDIILMDIRLPKLNGYETTQKIKIEFPNLPIIAQTAYSNYNDVVTALESGCDDFIAKPIKPKKLIALIEKYLNNNNELI